MEAPLKNVIVVAYYWPPAGGPGVQRWVGLTRYFKDHGLNPIIVVPKNAAYPQYDYSLENELTSDIEVIRISIWEPIRLAQRLGFSKTNEFAKGLLSKQPKGLVEKFLYAVRAQLLVPDSRIFWIKPLHRVLTKLIEQRDIEAIISTGPPHSVHLAVLKLVESLKIRGPKWIVDFRDPWVEIGYHKTLRLKERTLIKHKKLEKKVIENAQMVLTTTNTLADYYAKKYHKVTACVTNGFSNYYEDSSLSFSDDFNLLHVGSLFEHRNPLYLWRAIAEIRAQGIKDAERIKLFFLGEVSQAVVESLEENGLLGISRFEGYVPKKELSNFVSRSSLLLLCEAEDSSYEFAVPGKLYEYLSMKAPLLAIGPKNWEVSALLKDLDDTLVVTHQQKAKMKIFIEEALIRFVTENIPLRTARKIDRFEHQHLSGQLAALISRL